MTPFSRIIKNLNTMNEQILNDILHEVRDMRDTQDSTFRDLKKRLDALDRSTDIPLTPKQAATYLGVTTATLRNYCRKGLLSQKVRNGLAGYLRIDLEELKRNRQ